MNCLNHQVFDLIIDSVKISEDKGFGLIIYPDKSKHFSVGADLRLFYEQISSKNFKEMEEFIELGQKAMLTLKYAAIDVVSCAYGAALGGGCELLLHSHHIVAHQNISAGLVELGVGLIPGWGGVKEMFLRSDGQQEYLISNLQNILMQYQSASSDYFAEKYKAQCSFNMNTNYILQEALDLELKIKNDKTRSVNLPRIDLASKIDGSTFDKVGLSVLEFFQKIVDMGKVDEQTLLNMEKEQFLQMAAKPESFQRIKQLLG